MTIFQAANYGTYQSKKSSPNITVEPPGTALNTTETPKATQPVNNPNKKVDENIIGLPNELGQFASFNYIFSLFALSDDEVTNNLYRREDPEIICVRSGGGANILGGLGLTGYDNKFDYFIDNVAIESVIAANAIHKQSNSTSIRFEVFEPYSMGQFPLVLMQSAQKAKGTTDINYLSAPYLLTLEFVGWNDDGELIPRENTRHLRRMIPLYLTNIEFNVTEKGSVYKIQAIPWNEQAGLYDTQKLLSTCTLKGKTVKQMCQSGLYSISSFMNGQQQKVKENSGGEYVPDEYVILFPEIDGDGNVTQKDMFGNETGYEGQKTVTDRAENPADMGGAIRKVNKKKNLNLSDERIQRYLESSLVENADPLDKQVLKSEIQNFEGISIRRSENGEIARIFADDPINNNVIGEAALVASDIDPVKHPFLKPLYAEVTGKPGTFDRNKVIIQDGLAQMDFNTGATIQDMIEEIILMSMYGRGLSEQTPDSMGFYNWFRVELETYPIDNTKSATKGRQANLYVYRVVPYKIHKNRYQPLAASVDYQPIINNVAKSYHYLYTGKNDAVLDFNISYNKAFFVALTQAYDTKAGEQMQFEDSRGGNRSKGNKGLVKGEGVSTSGQRESTINPGPNSGKKGGGQNEKIETAIARDWNDIYLESPVDLLNCDLKIMGDPYFIADSGMGNYHSPPKSVNETQDGTMAYENGEVHVVVNFKAPLDYGFNDATNNTDDGYMNFKDNSLGVKGYSGVYQVITVTNDFNEGQFTQNLKLVRARNQSKEDVQQEPTEKSLVAGNEWITKVETAIDDGTGDARNIYGAYV